MMDNNKETTLAEIGALWEQTSKNGTRYFSGRMGNARLLVFESKSDNPKAPTHRVYVAPDEKRERARRPSEQAPAAQPSEDDIPF